MLGEAPRRLYPWAFGAALWHAPHLPGAATDTRTTRLFDSPSGSRVASRAQRVVAKTAQRAASG